MAPASHVVEAFAVKDSQAAISRDLVMRPLANYWRVPRQDNVVAQALLEKASRLPRITAKRSASLPPAIHSASTWLGRQVNSRARRQTRRAGGDPGRQRGPLGASCARLRL